MTRTFKHIRTLWQFLEPATREQYHVLKCTGRIGKRVVPTDLNGCTYGQIITFGNCKNESELIYTITRELADMDERDTDNAQATQVFGLVNMVAEELKRIGEMFNKLSIQPTSEEKEAGCEKLNFGTFGTLDWYARRMGIIDHDAVLDTNWMRIYMAMRIDTENAKYQRRLRDILNRKNK